MPAISSTLKRGADPYADAEAVARLCGPVVALDAGLNADGNPMAIASPIAGRVKNFKLVVTTTNSGAPAVVDLEVRGVSVGQITVGTTEAAGTIFSVDIPDDADNLVAEGDLLEINSDNGGTLGEGSASFQIMPLN